MTGPPVLNAIIFFMGGQIAEITSKCKLKNDTEVILDGNFSPHGGYTAIARVAVPYQSLQFMRLYRFDISSIFARPPLKSTGRKPFMADPKALTVIGENFDGGPCFIAKDKHAAAERVCF